MNQPGFFPDDEYAMRAGKVRDRMAAQDLDALLVSAPENIYYLIGLSHLGFFGYHMLIVPREGDMYLIARAMERVTVENQVTNARFIGYVDGTDPARVTIEALLAGGHGSDRIGIEKNGLFLPLRIAEGIVGGLPNATWIDASDLVNQLRLVKSPRELAYTRQAAAVSAAMMKAAIATAGAGVGEHEVAAEVHRAMILAGGEYPGFGPFIRSTPRLGEEHTTWTDRILEQGDVLFVELSGCVRRYHAPMGRLIFIGEAPRSSYEMQTVCLEAFAAVTAAIRPGTTAAEVYRAWQDRVDRAGLSHYRRHHCGYQVGIGFPPTWTGGSAVVGLRHDSPLQLHTGMVFHLLSWLMGTGRGDYFVSDTAILTERGCEVLGSTAQTIHVV